MDETLVIAGREFRSRLVLGTGGFKSHDMLARALAASGAEMCTVALRRLDPDAHGSILDVLEEVRRDQPFELEVRDIASDPDWFAAYRHDIPVLTIDGVEAFRHRVTAAALRAALLTARRGSGAVLV